MNFKEIDDKIVIFGQSCVGKTTFALKANEHKYHCFDALFQWHLIETLGLSISKNLKHIQKICTEDKFILDGWHLADKNGLYLPKGSVVYVIWSQYEKIISQYRVPVIDKEEHRSMYNKWYCDVNYEILPSVKYFQNLGEFHEITKDQFDIFKT